MQLIEILETRKDRSGHWRRYGKFKCPNPICNKIVIRNLRNGLKSKSCGCMTKQLISESNKGEKNFQYGKKGKDSTFFGKKHTEETRRKQSEGNKGKIVSDETRQKMREAKLYKYNGENNPNWQDGKSFEEYPKEFKQIREFILERDNYKCQCPDCKEKSNKLVIHHIDFNKQNNNPKNLITLCNSCHTKTNGKNNRQLWTEYYKEIINIYL